MAKEIVFTGTAKVGGEHMVRELLIEAAEHKGYVVGSAVTSRTAFLVVGDTGRWGATRKVEKATNLGVTVMSADAFYKTL